MFVPPLESPVRWRTPYLAVLISLAALIAAGVRWLLQGSGNVYTATSKRFYVPDRDLGWRVIEGGQIWLGLEAIGILTGITVAMAIAAWWLLRREARRDRPWHVGRIALGVVALATWVIPVAAFASGGAPAGARDTLPVGATAEAPTTGIEGRLELPPGSYAVVPHAGTSITAHLSGGGEAFDARWSRDIAGTWTGDPHDLTRPMSAQLSAATSAVDTGVDMRSEHARESYLKASQFPRIELVIDRAVATRQDGPGLIAYRAAGRVRLMGREHPVEVTGTLRAPDVEARQRLGFTADQQVLLVQGGFSITIRDTALAPDARSFDGDRIPIQASLVLTPQQEPKTKTTESP